MVDITIPSHLCYCYAGSCYPCGAGQPSAVWKFFVTLDGSREEFNDSFFKERKHTICENDVSHGSVDGSLTVSGGMYYTPDGRTTYERLGEHQFEFFDRMIVPSSAGLTYVASSFRSGNAIFYGWWQTQRKGIGTNAYWTFKQIGVPGCLTWDDECSFSSNKIKQSSAKLIAGSYANRFDTEEDCISELLRLPSCMYSSSEQKLSTRILFGLGNSERKWSIGRLPKVVTRFNYNEPQHIFKGRAWRRREVVETCRQNAFWKAADGIKVLNDNLLSTLIEAIQFLLSLKRGTFKIDECVPKSLTDLWLQYRYAYCTTKSDLEEGIAFIEWTHMFDLSQDYKTHGKFFDEEHGITCYCTLTVRNRALDGVMKAWSALRTYGLQPNFYLVWDNLPFSFIVDWFIPVGDLLDIIDQQNYLTDTFDCVSCVYSLKYDEKLILTTGEIVYHLYSRWLETHFPALEFQYLYDGGSTSDKTILFRCLDAASLILGRK